MPRVLIVMPRNRPGEMARILEVLHRSQVAIRAISASTNRASGTVHVLVDDADEGARLLTEQGIDVHDIRSALLIPAGRQAPPLGEACRTLADAGINVEQAYLDVGGNLVVVCEEVSRARELLGLGGDPGQITR